MISIHGLKKAYGKFVAVNGIDLHVQRGQLFGFLGPNGAGKTTTLRMIAGILRPTAGEIRLGGDDVISNPMAAKSRLGFIPDRPFGYEKLTGGEFLKFVAGLYGQAGLAVEQRIDELLEVFEPLRPSAPRRRWCRSGWGFIGYKPSSSRASKRGPRFPPKKCGQRSDTARATPEPRRS